MSAGTFNYIIMKNYRWDASEAKKFNLTIIQEMQSETTMECYFSYLRLTEIKRFLGMWGNEHIHALQVGMQIDTNHWWSNWEIWIQSLKKKWWSSICNNLKTDSQFIISRKNGSSYVIIYLWYKHTFWKDTSQNVIILESCIIRVGESMYIFMFLMYLYST